MSKIRVDKLILKLRESVSTGDKLITLSLSPEAAVFILSVLERCGHFEDLPLFVLEKNERDFIKQEINNLLVALWVAVNPDKEPIPSTTTLVDMKPEELGLDSKGDPDNAYSFGKDEGLMETLRSLWLKLKDY